MTMIRIALVSLLAIAAALGVLHMVRPASASSMGEQGQNQADGATEPDGTVAAKMESNEPGGREAMQVVVSANGSEIVFELNGSGAARALHAQLPLDIEVEDYGSKEKIFYPPKKLEITDTPLARDVRPGTLAYYAPWGDVVLFYDSFGPAAGLYELGRAVSGTGHIKSLSGTICVEAGGAP